MLVASIILNSRVFGRKKQILLVFDLACILGTFLFARYKYAIETILHKASNILSPTPIYSNKQNKTDFFLFLSSAIGLALLAGFLLPSSVIATSPTEFSFLGQTESPLSYIYSSACVFAGFFILWPVVIYEMSSDKVRAAMPTLFFVMFVCVLLNVYVFKNEYGKLNAAFILESAEVLVTKNYFFSFLPIISIILLFIIYILIKGKISRVVNGIIFSLCVAEMFYSFYNIKYIKKEFLLYATATAVERGERKNQKANLDAKEIKPVYTLGLDKKNVVIFFLDRGINSFVPYIFKQFPDLLEKYDGFTHYPNTISVTDSTITSSPAIFGGYEYTMENINKREKELLVDKHNESRLVMPKLFSDADYFVTISDPPYSNILGKDYSRFNTIKNVKVFNDIGNYVNYYVREKNKNVGIGDKKIYKGSKNFSIIQMVFPPARFFFYSAITRIELDEYDTFYGRFFYDNFPNLYYINNLTSFNSNRNTFTLIYNATPHGPMALNFPDFDTTVKQIAYDTTRFI